VVSPRPYPCPYLSRGVHLDLFRAHA
jgi:hypothetical protein